jgi:hypothetical protein
LPTTGTYFGVALADMNNDEHPDIIAASDGDGLRVFLGNGAGSWAAVASHPAASGGYGDVIAGDYDADGNPDIIAGSPGNSVSSPNGIHVWKGDGTGGFTDVTASTTLPTDGYYRGVAVGDVNNDGHLDIASTCGYGGSRDGIYVYTGNGAGVFTEDSQGLPTSQDRDSSAVLADFNNDGNLDVAAGGSGGLHVYLGDGGSGGSMTWTDSSTGLPTERFTGVKAADIDNDGSLDLVVSSYNAGSGVGMRAYRNVNNAASWTSASTGLPTEGEYMDVSTGDFDEDGNIDLIVGGVLSYGGIVAYYGDGAGTWTEGSGDLPTSGDCMGTDVGDATGDGKLDFVVGRTNGAGLEFWENLGSEQIPPTITSTSPADDSTYVAINTGISITFSRGMDTAETENAISSSPDITGSSAWSAGNTVFTYTPTGNLQTSCVYTVTISTAATSSNGINLESAYEFSFTTGANEDITAPTIMSSNPNDNSNSVGLETAIAITFSESMDAAVTESAISISPGFINELTWSNGGTVLTLSVSLEPKTTYTVTVSGNARDLSGNNLNSAESFSFTTGSEGTSTGDKTDSGMPNPLFIILPIIVVVFILVILMARKEN